jgi:UDP-N-acetylmuramoyl-L-alanyl-D-glutamate--2,6-diaminopimelate ligase
MTMPSGWLLHKWLRAMVKNGCHYAVLEISSEGLAQHRHYGINFDIALFTNLTPEHLESHGGFEQYKRAKAILFQSLSHHGLNPAKLAINPGLQKTIVANIDDPYGTYFLNFKAGKHITYGVQNRTANVVPEQVSYDQQGNNFVLHSTRFHLPLKGKFDLYNGLAAIASAGSVGISLDTAKTALEKIAVIPGRVEVLQQKPFTVVIDYAPEPYALAALYDTVAEWQAKRRIHLLGSTGGGRDKARRKILGEMAGSFADIVIVTNEDPYDDDPQEIIDEVASGALGKGKILGTTLFCELDRAKAIAKAVSLAKEDDLVLITGKGSEQKMAIAGGHYIDWDDRKITLDALKRLST